MMGKPTHTWDHLSLYRTGTKHFDPDECSDYEVLSDAGWAPGSSHAGLLGPGGVAGLACFGGKGVQPYFIQRTPEDVWQYDLGTRDELIRLGDSVKVAIRPFADIAKNRITLAETRSKALRLLELKDDWDESGASPFREVTIKRTIQVLESFAAIAERFLYVLPRPRINPAGGGSVDIYWSEGRRSLLINVPQSENEMVSYYGEDPDNGSTAGEFPSAAERPDLVAWLLG